jgi:MoaA/NifB/PqqE/SkfB family radical SAM enzyme
MMLEYEVEADWALLNTCNFRCEYCFINPDLLGAKLATHGTPAQWAEGFQATGKTWLLHITGGEPSIYPGFVDLCQQLSRKQYLSINSNLWHPCVDVFAERIDPARVHYINAAVHFDERRSKASLDVFIERVHKLQAHQFNVLVSMVMTPRMVSLFLEVSKDFEARGLFLIPKVMREMYQGNRYPAAYSAEQKALIANYLAKAQENYAPVIARMGEPATIDLCADGRFLDGIGDYRGKRCGSGYNFVRIDPDGTAVRCGSTKHLGNVLLKTINLLPAPMVCDTSYCPYFCEKYTSPRFVQMPKGAATSFTDQQSSRCGRPGPDR